MDSDQTAIIHSRSQTSSIPKTSDTRRSTRACTPHTHIRTKNIRKVQTHSTHTHTHFSSEWDAPPLGLVRPVPLFQPCNFDGETREGREGDGDGIWFNQSPRSSHLQSHGTRRFCKNISVSTTHLQSPSDSSIPHPPTHHLREKR